MEEKETEKGVSSKSRCSESESIWKLQTGKRSIGLIGGDVPQQSIPGSKQNALDAVTIAKHPSLKDLKTNRSP